MYARALYVVYSSLATPVAPAMVDFPLRPRGPRESRHSKQTFKHTEQSSQTTSATTVVGQIRYHPSRGSMEASTTVDTIRAANV